MRVKEQALEGDVMSPECLGVWEMRQDFHSNAELRRQESLARCSTNSLAMDLVLHTELDERVQTENLLVV